MAFCFAVSHEKTRPFNVQKNPCKYENVQASKVHGHTCVVRAVNKLKKTVWVFFCVGVRLQGLIKLKKMLFKNNQIVFFQLVYLIINTYINALYVSYFLFRIFS